MGNHPGLGFLLSFGLGYWLSFGLGNWSLGHKFPGGRGDRGIAAKAAGEEGAPGLGGSAGLSGFLGPRLVMCRVPWLSVNFSMPRAWATWVSSINPKAIMRRFPQVISPPAFLRNSRLIQKVTL